SVSNDLFIETFPIHCNQGRYPVQTLRYTRLFVKLFLSEPLDKTDNLAREEGRGFRNTSHDNLQLFLKRWIIDPAVQTTSFQRIVNFSSTVGCYDHNRRLRGADCTNFRDGYLKIRKDFQQKRFKFFVGTVKLID